MKKSILNLGKALNRAEQKEVNGGGFWPRTEKECYLCWGHWEEWEFPACALPHDSVCL